MKGYLPVSYTHLDVYKRQHQHYGLETEINDSLYDQLTAACLLPDTGARNIDSLLNQQILPVLSPVSYTHLLPWRIPSCPAYTGMWRFWPDGCDGSPTVWRRCVVGQA